MLAYKDWRIKEITGYEPKTTFYMDFSIADKFGAYAIKDTYKRAFQAWKDNTEYITELAMVLNWKSWEHNANNPALCGLYVDLYYELRDWCIDNLTGDDLTYFYNTTD